MEVLLEGSFNKQYVKHKNKIESYNLEFIPNHIFGELKKSNNERLFYYGYNFIYITGFSHSFAFAKIFYGTVGEMRG